MTRQGARMPLVWDVSEHSCVLLYCPHVCRRKEESGDSIGPSCPSSSSSSSSPATDAEGASQLVSWFSLFCPPGQPSASARAGGVAPVLWGVGLALTSAPALAAAPGLSIQVQRSGTEVVASAASSTTRLGPETQDATCLASCMPCMAIDPTPTRKRPAPRRRNPEGLRAPEIGAGSQSTGKIASHRHTQTHTQTHTDTHRHTQTHTDTTQIQSHTHTQTNKVGSDQTVLLCAAAGIGGCLLGRRARASFWG